MCLAPARFGDGGPQGTRGLDGRAQLNAAGEEVHQPEGGSIAEARRHRAWPSLRPRRRRHQVGGIPQQRHAGYMVPSMLKGTKVVVLPGDEARPSRAQVLVEGPEILRNDSNDGEWPAPLASS